MSSAETMIVEHISDSPEQAQSSRKTNEVLFTLLTYTYKDVLWGEYTNDTSDVHNWDPEVQPILSISERDMLDDFFLWGSNEINDKTKELVQRILDNTEIYEALRERLDVLTKYNFSQDIKDFLLLVKAWETFEYARREEEDFLLWESLEGSMDDMLEKYIHTSITWKFWSIWNANYDFLKPYIRKISQMHEYGKDEILARFDRINEEQLESISDLYPEVWLKITSRVKPWSNFDDIEIFVLENVRMIENKAVWKPYQMQHLQVAVARMFLKDELDSREL